ncbi:serine/threonine-protein phosphatase [Ketobacter sp. MCCC 1A13808]|uniref:PP2C family protein-serine/threonine phosphatase n=1 Tax=Ketobacter sp. MCCC 1A13808 TaxID=2602738 RepID=UPI0012EB41A6|nr:protein phosphatase 2C domain-containing protein [Ketobacter sp. MCCC 1A13808]MVF11898.1 serine/threonine-protein phosphatase [Ketobacter sp. MCCC 1A13808]
MPDIYGVTDIGCVRKHNEDWIHWQQLPEYPHVLAALADGMGGYSGGADASQIAGQQFIRCVVDAMAQHSPVNNDDYASLLLQAGTDANKAVREARVANPQHHKMGTTLLSMLLLEDNCWLLHAGDSRCYRSWKNHMQQMTRDHSLVQELVDKGSLSAKDAERAPFRNMLTRAVGTEDDLHYSLARHPVHEGESWLLCSDGLYNAVPEPLISEWLNSDLSAQDIALGLLQDSLKNEAQDNVSVIVLKIN